MSRDSGSEQPSQRTVAELLAEYGNSADDGGDDAQRGNAGRRRRRAEDPTETAPQTIIDRVLSDSGKLRPIDPDGAAPARTGHRAEPDQDAQHDPEPAEAEQAVDGSSEQAGDATASRNAASRNAADRDAGAADGPAVEQAAEQDTTQQAGKSGKGNYWARRFSVGRKSQARQQGEQASRSAEQQSPAQQSSAQQPPAQQHSAQQPPGQGLPGPPTGRPASPALPDAPLAANEPERADAGATPPGAPAPAQPEQYPRQAGQVDPEATVRQTPVPTGPAAGASAAPQQTGQPPAGQQPPAQQSPQPRGGQVTPHPGRPAQGASAAAQPSVVEGATEQFPAVRPPQQPPGGGAGGTAMLPAAEPGAPAYPDEAAYLGQPGPDQDRAGSYDEYDDDYFDDDAYAPGVYDDEGCDDYADDEYDSSVPAGMAAEDFADDAEDEDSERASGRREWFVFAGSTVLALLAGGVVWFAFRWLWTTFAPAALVAALAVIGCLVFVARKYLRLDDLQSVLLAVLVGLVCTVSPAAMLLISL